MRPDFDVFFLEHARVNALRGDCTRRRVGAVIVSGKHPVGQGYNGFPPGIRGCLDGACPRGRHYMSAIDGVGITRCICGKPWPCPEAVEPGSSYDTGPGFCGAVHAEINAIMDSSRQERAGATMYISEEACIGCLKIIACSGVVRVVWPQGELGFPFLSCYAR